MESTVERDFLAMMPFTVSIEPVTGQDRYGADTYGPAVEVQALIQQRVQQVRGPTGGEITVDTEVYLGEALEVQPGARLTLPDASRRIVQSANRNADDKGWHNTILYL
jgi:hypothetical protein